MNVLYVTNTLHKGGAEAHLFLLATGLLSHGATCEVAFLRSVVDGGSIDLRESFENAGIRTRYLGCERSYDVRAGVRLNRLLGARKWDVLHSHLPRADAAAAVCKLLNPEQTWIATLHHPYDNAYSGARLVPALAPMWRRADGLIAVSDAVREWAIARLGVSAGCIRTIVHGIDPESAGAAAADRLAPPPATRVSIGSIGRYEARKGHETLIKAMVPILKEFPDAQLRIAGHDPWGYGDVLRKLIAELGLGTHVHLSGFMSDKESFFSSIDVFAFASLSEGFGIVVLEAMAAGRPVVVSDIAPLNQIIVPGVSGLVADRDDPRRFAEAIISLFRDRTALRRIGEEGRRRAMTEFSPARMVGRTLDFYEEVAAKRGHRSTGGRSA